MKFKKIITAGLATGFMLGGVVFGSQPVAAALIQDEENNSQTMNNSMSGWDMIRDGIIGIYGTLGLDNTNPEIPEPSDPNLWLNITFPMDMVFYTTKNPDYDGYWSIGTTSHSIKNNSARPVQVDVLDYILDSGSVAAVATLDLETSDGHTINLVTDGQVSNEPKGTLMKLSSPKLSTPLPEWESADMTFSVSGQTVSTFNPSRSTTIVNSRILLEFIPLQMDGTTYPNG